MITETDVIVVGAGIAGLALAAALSKCGVSSVVIEAGNAPTVPGTGTGLDDWDLRVSALTPTSAAFLDRIGAWPRMCEQRVAPYQHMHVWDAEGTGDIRFDANDSGVSELGHIVENRVTTSALYECVRNSRLVEMLWQDGVEHIDQSQPGQVSVTTASGRTVSAPLLVGADGARSRVREQLEFPLRSWSYHQHAIVGTLALSQPHGDTCYQAFLKSGPVALLPLADPNLCALVWSIDDPDWESLMALEPDAFTAALNRALAGDAPAVCAVSERAVFPLRQCHAQDYVAARVALVADAAHSIHPLAGQGINLGLKDVAVLSDEIGRAFAQDLDWGELAVLRRYQRQRKTDNLTLMAAMEAFKRGFGSADPVLRVARNMGLNWVDRLGPLKHWLARRALT